MNNCCETLGSDFCTTAEKLISSEGLLKHINNGNKVVSELAHDCIVNAIRHTQASKCIPVMVSELNSKNGNVRAKISEYLAQVVSEYPETTVNKYIGCIETGIKQVLNDANKTAREHAKTAFSEFYARYPVNGKKMLNNMDPGTRKHVENHQQGRGERP